jgi:hypothetical protein
MILSMAATQPAPFPVGAGVAFSVWMAELMVKGYATEGGGDGVTFSVWTGFTVQTGKKNAYPRAMPLVTRMQELQAEQRRETNGPRV